MRGFPLRKHLWILPACGLVLAVAVWAQGRKAGLWEVTSKVTLQQSPFPPGMQMPATSPLAPGPHTVQVCLTQEMIDKFGAPLPQSQAGDCSFANVNKSDHEMTADLMCSGRMTGKGTVHSSWSDAEHAQGSVHFVGTVVGRNGTVPLEWTRDSTSVFKSADCGSVQPAPMPPSK
jgi:Protein of unknown function (DUF3617)